MSLRPALSRMTSQVQAAFKDDQWALCLPSFSSVANGVRGCEALQEELRKIKDHMRARDKSYVSFDAIAERAQVTLSRMISVFDEMMSSFEPLPSKTHIEHLIDSVRAAELLLSTVQSSHHVYDVFNKWYFLLCPSYYPNSCRPAPTAHNETLKELLQILGLMLCAVVPPDEELRSNFSGDYTWFKESSDSFELSMRALREGPEPGAEVCGVFGVSTGWFRAGEPPPATLHELSGIEVHLDFFHHLMQYTQGLATDRGSFANHFEGRLFGVFEDFLSMTVGQLRKQLEASQTTKAKILSELQTKAFTAVQMAAQGFFHCLAFCHI